VRVARDEGIRARVSGRAAAIRLESICSEVTSSQQVYTCPINRITHIASLPGGVGINAVNKANEAAEVPRR
jgi:hypothetical protein